MKNPKNVDLALTPYNGGNVGGLLERNGCGDVFLKLVAEGRTYQYIEDYLNEHHPRSDGKPWNKTCFYEGKKTLLRNLKNKREVIAKNEPDIGESIAKETVNITKRLSQVDGYVGKWLEEVDTKRQTKFICDECGATNVKNTFDPDKAVRVADTMRKLLLTAKDLTGSLPDVNTSKGGDLTHIDASKLIRKLAKEGVLTIMDEDKLKEYGI